MTFQLFWIYSRIDAFGGAMRKRVLSLAVFIILSILHSSAHAQAPQIPLGLSWLTSTQTATGNWPEKDTTEYYSTASALDAVYALEPSSPAYAPAFQWLSSQFVSPTDYLSRRIITLKRAGADVSSEMEGLLLYRNPDGGWGGETFYLSDSLDTALALQALKAANYSDLSLVNAGLAYLTSSQNTDGGWGFYKGNSSNVYMTAIVSATLQQFPQTTTLATAIGKATSYLRARQNADGGFGSSPSTVYETALAYGALVSVITDATVLSKAINYLAATQLPNGSWNDDPYSTALALQALYLAETRPSTPPPTPTTGTVNGTVVNGSTNQPLGGVTVQWSGVGGQGSVTTTTTGQFTLANILAGAQQITFSLSGYATSTATVNMTAELIVNLGSIALSVSPTTGIIQGLVTDASTGTPLADVTITVSGAATWTATTSADGSYRITDIAAGSVSISAGKTGYYKVSGMGTVTAGGTLVFSPSLSTVPPTATTGDLKGAVNDSATGLPLPGATISASGAKNYTASADASGNFALSAMDAGSYTVAVSAAGYGTKTYTVTIIAGTTTNFGGIALVMNATTGTVQGKVTDASGGAPIAGATITITGSTTWTAVTTADGSYQITGIAPGAITISAGMTGYHTASGTGGIVAGGTIVFSPALSTTPPTETTGLLKGTVADNNGQPLAGAAVSLVGNKTYTASTGLAGEFSVSTMDPDTYAVSLSAAGYLSQSYSVTILAGVTTDLGTVKLLPSPTSGSISGIVTDFVTGNVLAGVAVTVTGVSTWQAVTGSDGTYQIPDVTPGAVTLSAARTGYGTVTGSGIVTAGGILTFSPGLLALPTRGEIKGTVADSGTGLPIQGASVTISPDPSGTGPLATDASGMFAQNNIEPGTYTISINATNYSGQIYTATIVAGNTTDFGTIALAPMPVSTTITGTVTDFSTGLPIAGADVFIVGTTTAVKTDSSGSYTLSGISLSDFILRASIEGYDSLIFHISLNSYGLYEVNFELTASQASALKIVSLATDKQNYAAYAPVSMAINVQNSGSTLVSGTVSVSIENVQGEVVDYLLSTTVDANGQVQSRYDFQPGNTTLVNIPWDTKDLPPGTYAVIAKVLTGDAGVGGGTTVAVEGATSFIIDSTQAIASLALTPLPRFTNLGATEQVNFLATVANRSNVAVELGIAYEWRSPSGVLLKNGASTISLLPAESSKAVLLEVFPYTFVESGDHPVQVQIVSGPTPVSLTGGVVSTAPGIRIEPSQNLTPATVVPDGDKRIRIDIRLKGVEVKQ